MKAILVYLLRGSFVAILLTGFVFGQVASAQQSQAKSPFSLKVTTDKPNAIYKKGEDVKFSITVLDAEQKPVAGKKISVVLEKELSTEAAVILESKEVPVEVSGTMTHPGFILCIVNFEYEPGKKIRELSGAGFDPLEIKPPQEPPNDFKEFWDKQKVELAKIPMNPNLTPVAVDEKLKDKVESFDVRLGCVGVQVSGYYSRPVKAAAKSCPALLCLQGAGVRSSCRMDWRAAQGLIAMDINAHGIENGKSDAFYTELSVGKLRGYYRFESNDRDKCYFKNMFLRVLRALEFLKAQPEWDGKALIVAGSSQGGAQALMGAALDNDVTYCNAVVPAMCNHLGYLGGYKVGWPHLVPFENGKATDEAKAMTAPYFDMVNFAPYIKAETFIGVGLIDETSCPSSIYAMYNSLKCSKGIESLLSPHSFLGKQSREQLEAYIKKAKEEKVQK